MALVETQLAAGAEIRSMDIPNGISVAFDIEAFDEAIRAHGVEFVHFRGMRDPTGLVDRFDTHRPDGANPHASNGLIYTEAGVVTGLLTGNTKELRRSEPGLLDAGTAQLTVPRYYDGTTDPVYLHPMDRLFLKEVSVLVSHQQLAENHATGRDRLRFPAAQVLDCVDARGVKYRQSQDFAISSDGELIWGPRRPGVQLDGRGVVYAVRYLYRPHWYVDTLLHDVRVAQHEHPLTGERSTMRMPQSAKVQREYVFRNETTDPDRPAEPRSVAVPGDGQFGPR